MTENNGIGVVVFRLAGEEYALPVANVNSIIRYEAATPVPRSPEAVLGVINLRGRIIPVVDLVRRFRGSVFEPCATSRILVAEGASGAVGIAVDAASEVTWFDAHEISPVPDGVLGHEAARAFTGVVERAGALVILLDLDEAVPSSEYAGVPAKSSAEEEGDTDV